MLLKPETDRFRAFLVESCKKTKSSLKARILGFILILAAPPQTALCIG
jgi:hypothetical protein